MANGDQRNLNVNVSAEIYDAFSAQIEQRAQKKFRVVEAAMQAWMLLPVKQQQEWIEGKGPTDLRSQIVAVLQDLGLTPHIGQMEARADEAAAAHDSATPKRTPKSRGGRLRGV